MIIRGEEFVMSLKEEYRVQEMEVPANAEIVNIKQVAGIVYIYFKFDNEDIKVKRTFERAFDGEEIKEIEGIEKRYIGTCEFISSIPPAYLALHIIEHIPKS